MHDNQESAMVEEAVKITFPALLAVMASFGKTMIRKLADDHTMLFNMHGGVIYDERNMRTMGISKEILDRMKSITSKDGTTGLLV